MKGYSQVEIFTAREMRLWQLAIAYMENLPTKWDYDDRVKDVLRCHEIARAMGEVLNLEVQDGTFGLAAHSWLWATKNKTILDVYAVGSLPEVQLVDARPLLPHHGKYRPSPEPRPDIDQTVVKELLSHLRSFDVYQWLKRNRPGHLLEYAPQSNRTGRLSSDSCRRRMSASSATDSDVPSALQSRSTSPQASDDKGDDHGR